MQKDTRNPLWADIEKEIAYRASTKDPTFRLEGLWKTFVREQDGVKVFAVDRKWVQANLSCTFHHGGHGYVHEFIPLEEIWVSTHHHADEPSGPFGSCSCADAKNEAVSESFFESVVTHELTELNEMEKGRMYWDAHTTALEEERTNRSEQPSEKHQKE